MFSSYLFLIITTVFIQLLLIAITPYFSLQKNIYILLRLLRKMYNYVMNVTQFSHIYF